MQQVNINVHVNPPLHLPHLKRHSKTLEKEQLACEKCGKMIQGSIILKNMFLAAQK